MVTLPFIIIIFIFMTPNYFYICHKNKQKQTRILNYYFPWKFTLWYIKLSTNRKTSLLLKSSIHLVLSSLEIQRRVIQTKYTTLFYCLERIDSHTFKSSNYKKLFFLQCICYCYNLLWCFFFHVITGRHCYKRILIPWCLNHPVLALFEAWIASILNNKK